MTLTGEITNAQMKHNYEELQQNLIEQNCYYYNFFKDMCLNTYL
jgi:hypothetical protein